jgi:catechol 2,3-dioxygenase-like lactoylglutathione lyase family enzyme
MKGLGASGIGPALPQGSAMLETSDLIAFAAATDLSRAREFYERTLGLTVVEDSDFACVVDAHGTMLRITAVPVVAPAGYTVLGWRVGDIAAAVADLAGRGVVFLRYDSMDQDASGIWTTPGGDQVAWFADPDGNVLSLTQFGPARPGDTG